MRSHGSRGSSSRSSGRSHFGGSSSSRSHSSISSHRPSRPRSSIHLHIGGSGHHSNYYEGRNASPSAVLTVIGIILAIIAFTFGGFVTSDLSMKRTIVNDYNYYQEMIETAFLNSNYKKSAIVTNKFVGDHDRWWIEYSLNGRKNESFAVYSFEEVSKFKIGQTIYVAVDNPSSKSTDSIPMDYYDMPLGNDAEYITYQHNIILHLILTTISGAGSVLLFVLAVKAHKKEKAGTPAEDINLENIPQASTPQTTKCAYCGGTIPSTETTCPNCGAPKQ